MQHCGICHSTLEAERLRCTACGLAYEGRFVLPRLARLGPAEQDLAERVLLAAGNLKEVAGAIEVSYPTLRKRLEALILRRRHSRPHAGGSSHQHTFFNRANECEICVLSHLNHQPST